MKRKFTFLFALVLMVSASQAQWTVNTAEVAKTAYEITLDGDASDWPSTITRNLIERDYVDELPAFIEEPTWAALWTDSALFILIEYKDDDWNPVLAEKKWLADKSEVYIDVNDILADGLGSIEQGLGHYQIAPGYEEANNGVEAPNAIGFVGNTFDGGTVVREVRIPFASCIKDSDEAYVPTIGDTIGFDVYIVDNDGTNRQRKVWSNFGEINENYQNMDQAGKIILTDLNDPKVSSNTIKLNSTIVYPNPTEGKISFEGSYEYIKLYDMTGKLVKTFTDVSNTINIADFNQGMYLLNFNGKEFTRIIKD